MWLSSSGKMDTVFFKEVELSAQDAVYCGDVRGNCVTTVVWLMGIHSILWTNLVLQVAWIGAYVAYCTQEMYFCFIQTSKNKL